MKRNTQHDIVRFLSCFPNESFSENQLIARCFNYHRNSDISSNKKYAELLRRTLRSGQISRKEVEGQKHKFEYYLDKTEYHPIKPIIKRIEGIVTTKAIKDFKHSIKQIAIDMVNDGFEKEEIRLYFEWNIEGILNQIEE